MGQEKRWSTIEQVFIVSCQGLAITQMTMIHAPPYRWLVLGQESIKCEEFCQPHQAGPQQEQMDC